MSETQITIITDDPKVIVAVAAALGGTSPAVAAKAAEIAAKVEESKPPAKKTAAAPKAEEPAKEAEDFDVESAREKAVALATELVSDGKAKDVKAALVSAGVKKVSELAEATQFDTFFSELALV